MVAAKAWWAGGLARRWTGSVSCSLTLKRTPDCLRRSVPGWASSSPPCTWLNLARTQEAQARGPRDGQQQDPPWDGVKSPVYLFHLLFSWCHQQMEKTFIISFSSLLARRLISQGSQATNGHSRPRGGSPQANVVFRLFFFLKFSSCASYSSSKRVGGFSWLPAEFR